MEALGQLPEKRRTTTVSAALMLPARSAASTALTKTHKILLYTHEEDTCHYTPVRGGGLLSASGADVKENWEKICGKCHGPDGKGDTKMGQKLGIKDLTDAKLQGELKDDQAFKAVKEGIKDSEGKIKMKPAEGLSDDDIKALVAHVRTLKK